MVGGGVAVAIVPVIVSVSTGSAALVVASIALSVMVSLNAPATPVSSVTVGAVSAFPDRDPRESAKPRVDELIRARNLEAAGQGVRRRRRAVEHAERDRGRRRNCPEIERIGVAFVCKRPAAGDFLERGRRRDVGRGHGDRNRHVAEIGDRRVPSTPVPSDSRSSVTVPTAPGVLVEKCTAISPSDCGLMSPVVPLAVPRRSRRRRWRSGSPNSRRRRRDW